MYNNIYCDNKQTEPLNYPLSMAQRGIWFSQEVNPDAAAQVYKIAEYLEIPGAIDVAVFEQAVRQAVQETESPHFVFQPSASGPVQSFKPVADWTFPVVSFCAEADPEAAARAWIDKFLAQPFDLENGPLYSFALLRISPDKFWYQPCFHHLVMDGFGGAVFSARVAEIYNALIQGDKPPACVMMPVKEALEVQQAYQNSKQFQRDRQYWLEQLEHRPAPVSLCRQQAECAAVIRKLDFLPAQTTEKLRRLAQHYKAGLPQLLVTLIAMYLHRMTGEDDLMIGFPVTGRGSRALRSFQGMVSNVLPLRLMVDPAATLADLLEQVQRRILGMVRHQSYRGESLVTDLGLIAENSSLYSTVINILPFEYPMTFGGLPVTGTNLSLGPINDMSFNLFDRGEEHGLALCIDANTALYDEATVFSHFNRLMCFLNEAVLAGEETRIQDYPLLTDEERSLILTRWNHEPISLQPESCVHRMFEKQAALHPELTAVVHDGRMMQYCELNAKANQLAYFLRLSGIGPDKRVALCFDRGPDLLIAMLATLKAGGGYIPLDPAYPSERLQFILSDAQPDVLLSDDTVNWRERPEAIADLQWLNVKTDAFLWAQLPSDNLSQIRVKPENLAYIIYTSGSTGTPKGVMIEHRNLVNLIHWHNEAFEVHLGTCTSAVAGLGFDATVWELWPPLCAGATLFLPSLAISRDPDQLLQWWMSQPVEVSFLSTPVAELAFARQLMPPQLRVLLVGGDRLNRSPQANTPFSLVNNYGPTETTVVATSGVIAPGQPVLDIGRPVGNTRIYILDDRQQLVPPGVTGEIYIGGAGVARGYVNLPQQTAERFLTDPFSDQPDARMYRSGDLARWQADGTIEYLGRNDSQVKIRGFRIELGEISTALQSFTGIQNAVVTVTENPARQKRLIAYYTRHQGADISNESLKAHLSALLPDYMVPAAYVALQQMPLTANGKVNYRALPAPDEAAFIHQVYAAPETVQEQQLAQMWQSLLGVEKIGRHDHFFELGGHSLLAVQLMEQLRQAGYHLAVKALFDYPVLSELAVQLTQASRAEPVVPENLIPAGCRQITPDMLPLIDLTQADIDTIVTAVPGGAANVQDIYPLAPLQEGILFHHMLLETGDPYITRVIQAFPDKHQLDQFTQALQSVVHRHDILRTSLVWEGVSQPVQVVWREAPLHVMTLDIDADDVATVLQRQFDPAIIRLNIRQAPMIEAYQVADPAHNRWLLCLLMHHLCMDHTTLELMLEEVNAHLLHQAELLPDPLPFRNFVMQSRANNHPERQAEYFSQYLGDIDEPSLPFGLTDVQGDGQQVHELNLPLDDDLSQRLREQARLKRVSTASLFHLAWGMVVRAATGRDDVVFGTVLFGRMSAGDGADRVLGMFLNTLPVRLSLKDLKVEEALSQTHQRLAELLEHEHASLSLAQQCSGVAAQSPLFNSLINYRYNGGSQQLSLDAMQMDIVFTEERTNYPLTVSVNDNPHQGFTLDIQVDERVGCERVGAMMMKALVQLVTVLESAVLETDVVLETDIVLKTDVPETEPAGLLHTLNVLPDDEYQRVVYGFNQTAQACSGRPFVHQLFEMQAAQRPDAVAVSCDVQQQTYRVLNAQANRLAHYLRNLGVGPEKRVALCLDRGTDLVIAMLATLKAGGGYVPLDPTYPPERLQYILSDSAPDVVISDGMVNPDDLVGDSHHFRLIHIKQNAPLWADLPDQNLSCHELKPDNLAYVIYTSGSTGQPKGVMVEHHNLVNLVHWHNQSFEVTSETTASAVAGVGFDATVWEIWPPLCVGARLVMPSLAVSRNPEQLLNWWMAQPIEVGFLSTPVAELVLNRKLKHPTLKTLLVGGDKLNRHPEPDTGFTLINNYGPTECTVVATSGAVTCDDTVLHIGRPVTNTQIYILDEHLQPVPAGVKGELYIGGNGVARGYINREDFTAERFIRDPFSSQPNARMYRTGDLGCWRDDGTIEYLGRNDMQVKIRGYRIELGGIGARLCQCDGVEEAEVIVHQTSAGHPRLIAYYVGEAEIASVRDYAVAHLPDYMIPAALILMAEIPLTANGKIDRKALPEPDDSDYVTQAYEAPQGETEEALAAIWQRLLGVEKVGRQDNFFDLGGHSMLAVQMINEAQNAGLDLSLSTLFAAPCLSELAVEMYSKSARDEQVITFRAATGNQRPLFIIPEASGEMLYGTLLTSYIDADIPVYGLVAPDRELPVFTTLEGAAARYVEIIRKTQPQGPYRIFGWSFGGTLAWEVAAQLLGQDQEIEFFGLLDTLAVLPPIHRIEADKQQQRPEEERLFLMSQEVFDGLAFDIHGFVDNDDQDSASEKRWQDYYYQARQMGILPSGWTDDYYRRWLLHREGLLRADYRVRTLPVHIDVFIADERPAGESPEVLRYLGWDRVLPVENIRMIPVPGNHYRLVKEPYVGHVGKAISEAVKARTTIAPACSQKQSYPYVVLQIGHLLESGPAQGHLQQPTLLCFPGEGEEADSLTDVVTPPGGDWNVMAVQPRGLQYREVPHTCIASAAAYYQRYVYQRLLTGPLHLLGYGRGSLVAMTLAALLQADDIPVASLTLLDPPLPAEAGSHREYTDVEVIMQLVALFEARSGRPSEVEAQTIADLPLSERIAWVYRHLFIRDMLPSSCHRSEFEQIYRLFAAQIRAVYQPVSLSGIPVNLIVSEDGGQAAAQFWQQRLSQSRVLLSHRNERGQVMLPETQLLTGTHDQDCVKQPE
ncbi:Dimodular nonribosomal peptide synthase [Vibrio aerogenes CECT 7868]|uniref:Dimodular nonribosomal peptide synthase n=1 Tax=Vibrio aerogenes CECT 7868 TaxID=1216006 RepID=A0A1M5XA93_9VIBR|nr:non-ribosomal peptide synthetase [Vibrio aerogenes]SHH96787.1 Dimodular nonribosomal peptide synthase [Vibrio aerogenes CECT 7868]